MAAGRPKSIDDNKIFDVSKPGKSKPMGTSRPVIISRGNIITDPSDVSAPLAPPSATRKVINPVSDTLDPEQKDDQVVQVKVGGASKSLEESMTETTAVQATTIEVKNTAPMVEPETAVETPAVAATPATAEEKPAEEAPVTPVETATETSEETTGEEPAANPEPASEETPGETSSEDEVPATSESATVDALAESTTKKKEEEKELEAQVKRDSELQALIDSKKYFVPLEHDSSAKKSNTSFWIVLIVLLLAASAYVAIDMKLVRTGINLPFHLFKQ